MLFSFLSQTKIQRLPSLSIFLLRMWCKPWLPIRFMEPVHVPCRVAAGARIVFLQPLPLRPLFPFLKLRALSAKTNSFTVGLVGANGCRFFWETSPWKKAWFEMFTMWELLETVREKQPSVHVINTSFVCRKCFPPPYYMAHVRFCSQAAVSVSDAVNCNAILFKNM